MILSYLLLGLAVGFFAGLLGIGGGGVMVPVLTMLFVQQQVSDSHLLHLALGTSMASIVVTSIASMYSHHLHGAVQWNIVKKMSLSAFLGTLGLSFVAFYLSTHVLALFFSMFMAYVALNMFLNFKPKPSRTLPNQLGLSAAGFGIGGVSALVAIGGGSLSVPFLTWCNVQIKQAIGTSSALGLPIALAGTLGYMMSGWTVPDRPAYSLGYVYFPAVVLISSMSVLTAWLGAKLAHRLPVALLKKVFASILLLLAIKMLQVTL